MSCLIFLTSGREQQVVKKDKKNVERSWLMPLFTKVKYLNPEFGFFVEFFYPLANKVRTCATQLYEIS